VHVGSNDNLAKMEVVALAHRQSTRLHHKQQLFVAGATLVGPCTSNLANLVWHFELKFTSCYIERDPHQFSKSRVYQCSRQDIACRYSIFRSRV
jgi:hypothetical protein